MTQGLADVVVIGAGVVGTAIARTLARHALDLVLLDAAPDVGTGTSKANTAILHTGFDAKPGSLESRLLSRGSALLRSYAEAAGIPVERTGALLVAWTPEQAASLPTIEENARLNGYLAIRPLRAAELYVREPELGPGALGALEIPDESIICPWTTPLAFATEAAGAGVRLLLSARVTGVAAGGDGFYQLATTRGPVRCRWVVNAAGLGSDEVDRMFGGGGFTIRPRRGELIVFDKLARTLIRSILLPVPTARTKGVLVAPTVYGNVLLGPTAEDVTDVRDTATTAAGLRSLLAAGRRILPGLAEQEVTSTYAGLRAATEHSDYQIRVDAGRRYACAGGIRSTGLSGGFGPRPSIPTTRSGWTPGGGTRAQAASAPPGCLPRSGSRSTSSGSWARPVLRCGRALAGRCRSCRISGRRACGRTRMPSGSRPTRRTARSCATASGSPAARSGTPWPARCRPPTSAVCAAGPGP